ncbi:type VII toxin-antitoxin system HepT family RNase toxin [Alkalimarinus coralli]|uniref:type VII toxin-antitoxin system HepT family RNase toxin n=1 Tax=Alkalimarinus coralli TaxID=2935863 RepID=UPI00202B32A5|nr:DUF86 domain-containing protein [Alkalimarinus coralli]
MNDLFINKVATINRCIERIHQEFDSEADFKANYTKQDSVILNLQRACEASIDMANMVIRIRKLGVPQSSRDSFSLLERDNIIDQRVAKSMQSMVGLRNVAVHDYQALNLDIVIHVIAYHLNDFKDFARQIAKAELM